MLPVTEVTGYSMIACTVTSTHALPPLNVRVTSRVATYQFASWPTVFALAPGSLMPT